MSYITDKQINYINALVAKAGVAGQIALSDATRSACYILEDLGRREASNLIDQLQWIIANPEELEFTDAEMDDMFAALDC